MAPSFCQVLFSAYLTIIFQSPFTVFVHPLVARSPLVSIYCIKTMPYSQGFVSCFILQCFHGRLLLSRFFKKRSSKPDTIGTRQRFCSFFLFSFLYLSFSFLYLFLNKRPLAVSSSVSVRPWDKKICFPLLLRSFYHTMDFGNCNSKKQTIFNVFYNILILKESILHVFGEVLGVSWQIFFSS